MGPEGSRRLYELPLNSSLRTFLLSNICTPEQITDYLFQAIDRGNIVATLLILHLHSEDALLIFEGLIPEPQPDSTDGEINQWRCYELYIASFNDILPTRDHPIRLLSSEWDNLLLSAVLLNERDLAKTALNQGASFDALVSNSLKISEVAEACNAYSVIPLIPTASLQYRRGAIDIPATSQAAPRLNPHLVLAAASAEARLDRLLSRSQAFRDRTRSAELGNPAAAARGRSSLQSPEPFAPASSAARQRSIRDDTQWPAGASGLDLPSEAHLPRRLRWSQPIVTRRETTRARARATSAAMADPDEPSFEQRTAFRVDNPENAWNNSALTASATQSYQRLMTRYFPEPSRSKVFEYDQYQIDKESVLIVAIEGYREFLNQFISGDGRYIASNPLEPNPAHFKDGAAIFGYITGRAVYRESNGRYRQNLCKMPVVTLALRCLDWLVGALPAEIDILTAFAPGIWRENFLDHIGVVLLALQDRAIQAADGSTLTEADIEKRLIELTQLLARKETESEYGNEDVGRGFVRVCPAGMAPGLLEILVHQHPDVQLIIDVQAEAGTKARLLACQFALTEQKRGHLTYEQFEKMFLPLSDEPAEQRRSRREEKFFEDMTAHVREQLCIDYKVNADRPRLSLLSAEDLSAILENLQYVNFLVYLRAYEVAHLSAREAALSFFKPLAVEHAKFAETYEESWESACLQAVREGASEALNRTFPNILDDGLSSELSDEAKSEILRTLESVNYVAIIAEEVMPQARSHARPQ